MNKILRSLTVLSCVMALFSACSDDRDNNPVLESPTTFKLNKPAYGDEVIDLAKAQSVDFTWSQPNYGGFPVAATYKIQVSLTDKYTTTLADAAKDESGATKADYIELGDSYTECKGNVLAKTLMEDAMRLSNPQWTEDNVPAEVTMYARVIAKATGAANEAVSNSVAFKVAPQYVELADATPATWYITGACIGDGAWNNSAAGLGTSVIPMFTKAGYEYDKTTGVGEFEYTGYFPEGGAFKIVQAIGDWDHGFCGTDGEWLRGYDGSDDKGNITLSQGAGYYRLTVNSTEARPTLKIEKLDITPTNYSTITLTGSHNGWPASGDALSPVETYAGAQNHLWTITQTFTDNAPAEGGCKFNIGNWDTNWGAPDFPFGTGTQNGANIVYKAGTYVVVFNDITGQYMFIEK